MYRTLCLIVVLAFLTIEQQEIEMNNQFQVGRTYATRSICAFGNYSMCAIVGADDIAA